MLLILDGHNYRYEMENLTKMFFHGRSLTVKEGDECPSEDYVKTTMRVDNQTAYLGVNALIDGKTAQKSASILYHHEDKNSKNETERQLAVLLYEALSSITGIQLKWGILTGIRPVKWVHKLRDEGMTDEQIRSYLKEKHLVSDGKVDLIISTADREAQIIAKSTPVDYSLYLSVPFCPTRCSYCSFVSHSIQSAAKVIPDYLEAMHKEIKLTGEIMAGLGLSLRTVYFGGGTPTTLSADQLSGLMEAVEKNFDLSRLIEYTVEAGRPDTITGDKLRAIKQGGAGRISINPQTFNDDVLRTIGRRHTAQQTLDAYALAQKFNFDTINMDLIAGLTGDTIESFAQTLETTLLLAPQNITVHTLSVKRAARLSEEPHTAYQTESLADDMIACADSRLRQNGYGSYYLYRQKNTMGNLENVGYSKPGHDGAYNVFIMDETHSIISVGAGAVTKLRQPGGGLIERQFNYKFPFEYIRNFQNIIDRKQEVISFYERYGQFPGACGHSDR